MNITSGKNTRTLKDTKQTRASCGTIVTKIRQTPRCITPAGIAVYNISIDKIAEGESARASPSPESIAALAASIHKYGVIHPLTVRTAGDGRYELVCGHRRLRAVKLLGLESVNCIVITRDRSKLDAISLCENVQSEQLHYLDIAEAIGKLCVKYGYNVATAASKLCLSERFVTDKLHLLEFSAEQRRKIRESGVGEAQLMSLLSVSEEEVRARLLEQVICHRLDRALTDELVFSYLGKRSKRQKQKHETFFIRDIRIFYNTIDRALDVMRQAGYRITAEKSEFDECTQILIRIPK